MLDLLKIEWLKVKHYTTFWVLSILYFVSLYGVNYVTHAIMSLRPKKDVMANALIGNPFRFPDVWQMAAFTSSFLMFFPGLLMIISFTNEYSYKTHRQNIIDGWSRTQFIGVKILLTVIVAFFATLAVFLVALGFGLFEEASSFSFENIEYIGYFFIQALSYCGAALLFSLLFKRSGITIGVYFLYTTVIENMLAGLLNHYTNNFGRYLPLETTDNLIRVPVLKMVVNQFVTPYNTAALLIMSFVYLSVYYFISIRKFQRDDL